MLRNRRLVYPTLLTSLTGGATLSFLFFATRQYTHSGAGDGGGLTLTIGDITVPVPDNPRHPERVFWLLPGTTRCSDVGDRSDYGLGDSYENSGSLSSARLNGGNVFFHLQDPTTRAYLRWMCQKERLRQDMCLVGEPGPAKRWLVQMYAYLVRREVQCLALNRDTTESDLGQRREIRNGTLVYDDQCVVVAAREGQLLLLEGLEKVERNVLPVINNLLENREMHLENGMMLIHPERYDRLLHELCSTKRRGHGRYGNKRDSRRGCGHDKHDDQTAEDLMTVAAAHDELRRMGFIRVSEHFRVVGLTVPVPPYEGNPLDPPLRSRFQCLYVDIPMPDLGVSTSPTTATRAKGTTVSLTTGGGRRVDAAESLLKLRAIIDEVNASTKEFTTSGKQTSGGGGGSGGSAAVAHSGLQTIGSYELAMLLQQLRMFPDIPLGDVLPRAFPWMLYAQQTSRVGAAHIEEAERRGREYKRLLDACQIGIPSFDDCCDFLGSGVDEKDKDPHAVEGRSARGGVTMKGGERKSYNLREKVASLSWLGTGGDSSAEKRLTRHPEQFNDVLRIENVRVSKEYATVVLGDACVACTRGNDGNDSENNTTYSLPIYMGESAMFSTTAKNPTEKADTIAVDEYCRLSRSIFTPAHHYVLQSMLQLHIAGQHILLLGPTGCGKTTILHEFANLLGYRTETMYLYADMTNKDLFQCRTTDSSTGDTTWRNTALVEAALGGHIAVLDGIDKLPHGMLSSLQQLLVDGSTSLYNGTLLKSQREYDILKRKLQATDEAMRARGIFPVHPAFRVIATARPAAPTGSGGGKANHNSWKVSQDVTSLFGLVMMPTTTRATLHALLLRVATSELRALQTEGEKKKKTLGADADVMRDDLAGELMRDVDKLLRLRDALAGLQATEPRIPQLSLRQLLHLIRFRVHYPNDFTPSVESALLLPLMTALTSNQVRQVMRSCGFDGVRGPDQQHSTPTTAATIGVDVQEGRRSKRHDVLSELPCPVTNSTTGVNTGGSGGSGGSGGTPTRFFAIHSKPILRIDRVYTEEERAAVPYVSYFQSNPVHESIIAWLAKQYAVGNNILLIGNQGVGKNKVVDAFLSRIGVPRQYIQLHRDTTVGSLTINPTVEGGRVVWVDSPLVKAVQRGHCLVVDEIDKAPVEVVQVLKGLVEDHEMRLRDGRQIRGPRSHVMAANNSRSSENIADSTDSTNVIAMHPDFRVIVLANPPGFPFHGNDFYRECGDLFASYVMGNPDALSQLRVLKAYGPNIPDALLVRLIGAFQRLQKSFEEGHLTYPFSLRELIAVVKHMAAFPHDGVYEALNNVFNFDARDENTLHHVRQILHLHFHQLVNAGGMKKLLPLRAGQELPLRPLPQLLHLPSLPSSSLSSSSSSVPQMDGATSLSVRFLTDAECGGPFSAQPVSTWYEQYKEADFSATRSNEESDGFTEWLAAPRLPFLRSQDVFLGVTTLDTDDNTGIPTTMAVLFARPEENGGTQKLLLAVMTPLSVASVGMPMLRRSNISPGQVQFFDLSSFIPKSSSVFLISRLNCLHALNAESHEVLFTRMGLGGWLRDAFSVSAALVAVVDAHSGLVLLVNTSVAATCLGSVHSPTSQRQQPQDEKKKDHAPGVVLPVRLAPPVQEQSSCTFSVRPSSGVIAMTRPRNAELYLWMNGHRVAITFPAKSIDEVRFFTDNLAAVRLVVGEMTVNGVLKVAVLADGEARASLCYLPGGVGGSVVGFAADKTATSSSKEVLLQPVSPNDLRGAVIVPSNGNADDEKVVYMTVEEYAPDTKMWSMRVFTDKKAAAALRPDSLYVDHTHHQLLAMGQSEAGRGESVVAVNFHQHTGRRFAPPPAPPTSSSSSSLSSSSPFFSVDENTGVALWYENAAQRLLMADIMAERVEQRYRTWSALLDGSVKQIGAATSVPKRSLPMTYSTPRKKPSGSLKHGKEDDKEHHGGNTYAGGTGGTDTAGLGGIVGPYRLDKGWPVHQVSPELKKQVPPHITAEAKRMGRLALEERLREIGMSSTEYEQYRALQERVRAPVALLRSVLGGLKAAEGERAWLRGQSDGVWDDSKIVEGIVGDRNIYKRRADSTETNSFQSQYKKRLLFVLDVSASMYRFEGMDHRLTKLLESTVMVMEAFAGFEDKIDYAMIGHNGDSACIELVRFGQQPSNQKARVEVCQRMIAYAQYCWSGDNTVEAMRQSIHLVTAEKGSSYLVFVISDANLSRYGITPSELSAIMRSHKEVQMFCIFIASLGEQALNLQAKLPPGHGFECMDTQALPHILKQIFISVNLF